MKAAPEKSALRASIRERVSAVPRAERSEAAQHIIARLVAGDEWRSSRNLLLYAALPDELNLDSLVERAKDAGKTVALPRFVPEDSKYEAAVITSLLHDCISGRFGVHEPAPHCPALPLNQLDLLVVPGVAFDASGLRLGRGRGYYDRMLAGVRGIKCGVALDCQVIESLPAEPHDVRLNCLVTPTRWLEFGPAPRL